MSADIVNFRPRDTNGLVLEHLESLLEKARSGELTSIAYATVTRDGNIGCGWAIGDNQSFQQVASIKRLARKVEAFAFD